MILFIAFHWERAARRLINESTKYTTWNIIHLSQISRCIEMISFDFSGGFSVSLSLSLPVNWSFGDDSGNSQTGN